MSRTSGGEEKIMLNFNCVISPVCLRCFLNTLAPDFFGGHFGLYNHFLGVQHDI